MSEQQTEAAIQIAGKTAPRITPADVDAAIASVHYFTARHGVLGELTSDGVPATNYEQAACPGALSLLTFCVLVLRNGFTVTGESACASPENFDAEIGRKIAYDNARAKVWPLLGYQLRDKLAKCDAAATTAPTPKAVEFIGKDWTDFKRYADENIAQMKASADALATFAEGVMNGVSFELATFDAVVARAEASKLGSDAPHPRLETDGVVDAHLSVLAAMPPGSSMEFTGADGTRRIYARGYDQHQFAPSAGSVSYSASTEANGDMPHGAPTVCVCSHCEYQRARMLTVPVTYTGGR